MRYTYEHMKSMLQGAYKKLKSYYFYDKTLLFIKKKIAEFESDDGCFQQTFDVLAKALISENSAYFEELINQLDYRVFPKRLVAASAPTSTIVGTIDHHKNIAKVNFFIDVPIELLILDCLWTLCIAKISNKKYGTQACSYAGKFKASVFYFDQDDLYEGIDWESNRCFEPYYENYSRWQKDAFSKLRQGLLVQNQLMLSLDLKSFYYSVRFEFDSLSALLSDDSRLSEISFISHVEELFRMANAAVKEGANFITFPEFFIPIVWLKDLTRFSQKNNVSIIAGLRYIRNANRAFNCTTIIQPCNNNGFVNTIALFREKNFYAPEEKDCLYKLGYRISNPERPLYYVICSNGIRYSTILCFEFTDIYSRASLKSKVDALFVPQLNKDTNYFSSIVESTSRDLHCLIVQANTSKYGDSRVTGPYDTIHKNVVQIKGGVNDVVIIGELEFEQIRNARQLYEANHKKTQFYCFDCKKVKKAKYPNFFKVCNNCPHQVKKQAIKDVPANFE